MITNSKYQEYLEKNGLKLEIVSFFLPYTKSQSSLLCMDIKCPMKINDLVFENAYKLYMYLKSLLYNSVRNDNMELSNKIYKMSHTMDIKRTMRASIDEKFDIWFHALRYDYYLSYISCYHKFIKSGTRKFIEYLLSTGDKYLAYSNPNDKEEGCYEDWKRIHAKIDCNTIKGRNVFGCVCMEIRSIAERKRKMSWSGFNIGEKHVCIYISTNMVNLFKLWLDVVADEFGIPESNYNLGVNVNGVHALSFKCDFSGHTGSDVLKLLKSRLVEFPETKILF